MSKGWPNVPLGEVLTQDVRYIDVPEARPYPKLSVKLYGKGVVLDAPADGATLKMKRHQIARSGQVILSEIWGKKGAIGLVPPDGEGALCTSHFFLFDARPDRISLGWLRALFQANYLESQLNAEAKGTTGYAAVRPKDLLKCLIPLPPLAEQGKLVERIRLISHAADSAKSLADAADIERDALCRSILAADRSSTLTPLAELVDLRKPDVRVAADGMYQFAGVYSFGRGVFRANRKSGRDFAYPLLTTLHTGDFVYPKLMAREGAFGVVSPECDGCVVSTEFPVFQVRKDRFIPDVLDIHFRDPAVWPVVSGASTGTNVRRRRLNPSDFLAYRIPLPAPTTQAKVAEVRRAMREVSGRSVRPELDRLISAVLDRTLAG